MYHGIVKEPLEIRDWCFLDASRFTEQMKYLKANFDILPLSQAVKRLKERGIQKPTVSITFDDGFLNNYDVVYPIISNLDIPIAIYITTGFVDTHDTLWYCRLNWALSNTERKYFEWREIGAALESADQKSQFSTLLQNALKKLPHVELQNELDMIIEGLGLDPHTKLDGDSPFQVLNSEAINLMSKSRLVEIGAHTHSHSILSKLSLMQKRQEIMDSIHLIEKWTESRCLTFAYPNGRPADYDAECIDALQECGIETALTTTAQMNDPRTSRFELGRFGIGSDTDFELFKLIVHGVTSLLNTYGSKFRPGK